MRPKTIRNDADDGDALVGASMSVRDLRAGACRLCKGAPPGSSWAPDCCGGWVNVNLSFPPPR